MEFYEENYRYIFEDDYTFQIIELDNLNNKLKEITFNRNNDYSITIFNLIDFKANFADEIDIIFCINSKSPLYSAFLKLLDNKDSETILDDFHEKKSMEIKKNNNLISFNLTSKSTDEEDYMKNAVQIKDIMQDLIRSRNNEIKIKLFHLFNDVKDVFIEKSKLDGTSYKKTR
jgi:hypothetical protein